MKATLKRRAIPVALLLIMSILLSVGSGLYAGASFFAQQAPNVTVTTTLYTTTTSWTTSTIWSTVTSVVAGVWTTVDYTTSTSTVTMTGLDTYTRLLLHMDGTDGSQAFVDSSTEAHSITAKGNAQIDTAQSKFGGASGLFDGSGDYLSLADSADWAFGTGDFTIDFWVRFNALPASGRLQILFSQYQDGYSAYYMAIDNNAGTYRWVFRDWLANVLRIEVAANIPSISVATWYHVALVRSGSNWHFFQDGTQVGSTVVDSDSVTDFSGNFLVGGYGEGSYWFNGWLDEFRISKGIARWTSNFTPPTSPY
jgi:hypothetical protein